MDAYDDPDFYDPDVDWDMESVEFDWESFDLIDWGDDPYLDTGEELEFTASVYEG